MTIRTAFAFSNIHRQELFTPTLGSKLARLKFQPVGELEPLDDQQVNQECQEQQVQPGCQEQKEEEPNPKLEPLHDALQRICASLRLLQAEVAQLKQRILV